MDTHQFSAVCDLPVPRDQSTEFYHPESVKPTLQIGKFPHGRRGHFDMMDAYRSTREKNTMHAQQTLTIPTKQPIRTEIFAFRVTPEEQAAIFEFARVRKAMCKTIRGGHSGPRRGENCAIGGAVELSAGSNRRFCPSSTLALAEISGLQAA
jgi:hypothetical protein